MDNVIYHKLSLDPNKAYYLYVGELRSASLCETLAEPLSSYYQKRTEQISIVQDVRRFYHNNNVIVINRDAKNLFKKTGKCCHIKIKNEDFLSQISESELLKNIFERILRHQSEIVVNVYENNINSPFQNKDKFKVISPNPQLSVKYNNKILQYEMAENIGIPVMPNQKCESLEEVTHLFKNDKRFKKKAFVTENYSAGGSNSLIVKSPEDLKLFKETNNVPYLIVKFLSSKKYDPTALAVIANEDEILVVSINDQFLKNTSWKSSIFPSCVSPEIKKKIVKYTIKIGKEMAKDGYRGLFGVDYMIDRKENIYFVEINARKQGSSTETAFTMQNFFGNEVCLPELETNAVWKSSFNFDIERLIKNDNLLSPRNFNWGMYWVKLFGPIKVVKEIPQYARSNEDLFLKYHVYERYRKPTMIISDFLGRDTYLSYGFLGKVTSVNSSRKTVVSELRKGKRILLKSYEEVDDQEIPKPTGFVIPA